MELSTEVITILMFAVCFGSIFLGLPVALAFGGTGMLFALIFAPEALSISARAFFSTPYSTVLVAFPMFIFMGCLVRHSGIAERAYDIAYGFLGSIPGGLAMGTVVICMLFAAVTGITPTATIAMGLIAIPSMLNHRYDRTIAIGSTGAGGALGALIPPSIPFIFYGLLAKVSIGKLFIGGIIPGLLLGVLFIIYIFIRCKLDPSRGPVTAPEERPSWGKRFKSLNALWPFIVLIFLVLGVIWLGVATPAEASCFGAVGALAINAIYRRLTWSVLRESLQDAVRLSVMGLWILIGAVVFVNVFGYLGCQDVIVDVVIGVPGGQMGAMIIMMLVIMVLGCLMDDWAIINFCVPLFMPILKALNFDLLWFGICFIVNIQIAYQSPPFGFVLIWLKSIGREMSASLRLAREITMGDIYRSTAPFVACKVIGLALIIAFPKMATWLPNMVID